MNMRLGKLWDTVRDREPWHAAVHEVSKNEAELRDMTKTRIYYLILSHLHLNSSLLSLF